MSAKRPSLSTLLPTLAIASLAWGLAGCGSSSAPSPTSANSTGPSASGPATTGTGVVRGRAQAGPSQISGAHVYLYAANTNYYGAPSMSLLDPAAPGVSTDQFGSFVTTNAQGGFSLGTAFHCAPGQIVYIVAQGGTPTGEGANPHVTLLSIFGVCPADSDFSKTLQFVDVNQVSTVVTTYALAGFMNDATHVSSGPSANAQAGLRNAILAVTNVMDISVGTVYPYTPQGSGVIPTATLNTLANMIVPCSNAASSCSALFAASHDLAGNPPNDTVQALLNIARNPGANVSTLFALAASQPFQPALKAVPNDWSIGITYFAENMAGPYYPAFDGGGNLWVPGYANNTLTEFDPLGNLLSGSKGFTGGALSQPFSVAIDGSGNAWTSNYGAIAPGTPSVSEFSPSGTPITSNGFACGAKCSFLAIDGNANLWVSGSPQVSVLRSSGVALSAFSTNGFSSGVAIDSQGRGWAIGSGRNLSLLTIPGSIKQFTEGVSSPGGNELTPLAIDAADTVWFASPKNNALGAFSKEGSPLSPAAGFTGGGLNGPAGIAVDGGGRIWVANRDGNSISAFDGSGKAISPASGYVAAGVSNPRGIAVDPSGNVWVTNFTGNSVTEFLGAGTPTATPMTPATHGRQP